MVSNNIRRGHALRIAFGITVLILLSGGAGALSNSGGGSWTYYKDITISNSGAALSDYQVLVNLTSSNFPTNAQSNGADVRFTDSSGAELSYWIESWDYAGRSAKIWVKVPGVAAGSSTIRMWYGNAQAMSASNGTTTFIFFDDFNNNDYSAFWEPHVVSYTIVANNLLVNETNQEQKIGGSVGGGVVDRGKGFRTINNFSSPFIYEFKRVSIAPTGDRTFGFIFLYQDDNNHIGYGGGIGYVGNANRYGLIGHNNSVVFYSDDVGGSDDYGNHIWGLSNDGTTVRFYSDRTLIGSYNISLSNIKVGSTSWERTGTNTIDFRYDDVRVRKYASPEPSVSVGAEQSASPLLQKIWQTNLSSSTPLWPAVGDLNGDGIKDVVTGTNTRIYALNGANGQTLWTYDFDSSMWRPTVKDVDSDGLNEVIVLSKDSSSGTSPGKVIALSNNGQVKWMYNLPIQAGESAADDINGDGRVEVIVGLNTLTPRGGTPSYVYVLNGSNGALLWSFSGNPGHSMSRIATGDVDGDGIKDILAGQWDWGGSYVYAINGSTHNTIWSYSTVDDVMPITVEDLNNDNKTDVFFDTGARLVVLNSDGSLLWKTQDYGLGYLFWPTAGDINGDGKKEIVSRFSTPSNSILRVFNGTTGSILWSYTSQDNEYGYPSVNDVNSDGVNEIIAAFYNLTVFRGSDGSILQEIPLNASGKTTLSEDLNGDGTKEVVAIDVSGNVYLFAKPALTSANTLDGNLSDWSGTLPLITDQKGDALSAGSDIKAIYGKKDENYLYLTIDLYNPPASDGYIIDLDTTGGSGNEFFVESSGTMAKLFHVDWGIQYPNGYNTTEVGSVDMGIGNGIEYQIPLSLLGNYSKLRVTSAFSQSAGFYNHIDDVNIQINQGFIFANISLDGSSSEWSDIPPVVTDSAGDSIGGSGLDIKSLYMLQDNQYLYLRMDMWDGQTNTSLAGNSGYTFWIDDLSSDFIISGQSVQEYELRVFTHDENHDGVRDEKDIAIWKRNSTSGAPEQGYFVNINELYPDTAGFADNVVEARIPLSLFNNSPLKIRGYIYLETPASMSADVTDFYTIATNTPLTTPTPSIGAIVSIADTTATQNSNVTLPIMVENVTNLAAATIELTYDPYIVNVLSVSAGDLGAVTANIDNSAGKTSMTAFSNTGKSGNVTFANVVLRAVGSINSTSPLTLSVAVISDQNTVAIPYSIRSGTFTVSAVSKGDVNSDGQINVIDALLISQYTVGMRTFTQAQLAIADVNGDGQVTIVDALFIAQATVGLRQL